MVYSGVVLDLDGTVYRGSELLPGAADAVDAIRAAGCSVCWFSNNPTRTREGYVDHLADLGLTIDRTEVLSAGTVTTEYLATEHATDEIYLIGSPGLHEQFETADLRVTDDPATADVLVTSWDDEFDYESLIAGLRALDDPDTVFLGSDPDRVVPADGETLIPGSGAIIGAIEAVTDRSVDRVMGKPAPTAVDAVQETLDCPPQECLVVGDRLDTDIALGERADMTTVLVLTGITDRGDIGTSEWTPDHVLDSLADLPPLLN